MKQPFTRLMSIDDKKIPSDASEHLLARLMMERYGAVIGGRDLRTLLGFRSSTAFGQAVRRGDISIRFFKLPRRRGYFALVTEIAAWLQASWARPIGPGVSEESEQREGAKM